MQQTLFILKLMKALENTIVRVALTVIVFGGGFALALWLANVDVRLLVDRFMRTRYALAFMSVPIILFSHVVRAWRWQSLLTPIKPAISMVNLFSAVMVGYAANNIVPRSGEVLRPYTLHRREHLSLSALIASVIVERFIDIVNLLLFLSVALYVIGEQLQQVLPAANLPRILNSVALSSVMLLVLLVVFAGTTFIERLVRLAVAPFAPSLWERIDRALLSFKQGLAIVRQPGKFPVIIAQSLLIWLLYVLPVYVMCLAFPTEPLQTRSFFDACVILLIMAVATTCTPPVPGGFVVIPALLGSALVPLYGCTREDAAAFAFLTFMLNYLPVTVLGGLFMMREQVRPNSASDSELESDPSSGSAGD